MCRIKEEGNFIHNLNSRKANWIGHILRRYCLQKHFIEVALEGQDINYGKTKKKT